MYFSQIHYCLSLFILSLFFPTSFAIFSSLFIFFSHFFHHSYHPHFKFVSLLSVSQLPQMTSVSDAYYPIDVDIIKFLKVIALQFSLFGLLRVFLENHLLD